MARSLHWELDEATERTVHPVLLHHDLQPGHLLSGPAGARLLID
ncbi:hypothetical protein [Streptomyces sp. NPDC048196]